MSCALLGLIWILLPQAHSGTAGRRIWALAGAALAFWMTATAEPALAAAGPALLLVTRTDRNEVAGANHAIRAILLFSLYRLLLESAPGIWLLTDRLSSTAASVISGLTGHSLWVGASIGGLDFVVLSSLLLAFSARSRAHTPRVKSLALALPLIATHGVYLGLLSLAPWIQDELGQVWLWSMPILALLLHATYWSLAPLRGSSDSIASPSSPRRVIGLSLLAVLAAMSLTLPTSSSSLEGKKIVAFKECYGNWMRPVHGEYGRLSIGMYGMLEPFVESLGAEFVISPELSKEDLEGADVLIVLYPYKDWKPGQLERIERFVRQGGSLLLMGEHTTLDEKGGNRFNDVLAMTSMQVRFDSSMMGIGGWLQSYLALTHPSTVGIGDERNEFGVVTGASLEIHFPANPILIGRFGWADPGDPKGEAQMGNHRYDPGEKLGDQILAAEQKIGKGRVIAFGDTSTITNGIMIGSHAFCARLLSYLACQPGNPQDIWRQVLSVALVTALALGFSTAGPGSLAFGTLLLFLAFSTSQSVTKRMMHCIPDGRRLTKDALAYVDHSHLGRFDNESWRPDGDMGCKMMLMRNGFLTLELHDFTAERLARAQLLVSIAPNRPFARREIEDLDSFVRAGGIFVLTVAYEDRKASETLLRHFGYEIGRVDAHPGREPQPMGHFKAPYLQDAGRMVYVRFHEGWPVACDFGLSSIVPLPAASKAARVIAYGKGNYPIILKRVVGRGAVVVVADTGFLLNKNLEVESGAAFDGMMENPDFWRWFLTDLRGTERWLPEAVRPKEGR